MKIMVIFTGGTIGSSVSDGFISPDNSKGYKLISEYEKIHAQSYAKNNLTFHTCMPYSILSENLNGEYLNNLSDCVKAAISSDENYDGIVVTHGTDTLQYTATAMDYIFADTKLPIVLVSSNYILDDERANGLNNFYFAIEFIKKNIPGVFVSYRNMSERLDIHYGSRLLPHMTCHDEIYSIGDCYFGRFMGTKMYTYKQKEPLNSTLNTTVIPKNIRFSKNCPILYIKAMPGLIHPTIPDSTTAILIDSYHSGTICTESQELSDFTKEAQSKNIPIFLVGAEDRTAYESTKIYENLGINVLPKSSPIAIYVKLWLLSQLKIEKNELIKLVYTPISKEFV